MSSISSAYANNEEGHGDNNDNNDQQELNLNWKAEVNAKKCNAKGNPIVNVSQKILNDVDSGEAGNYWAYDTIERQIKVYSLGENTYCATVSYEGRFDTIPGQRSPGNTGTLGSIKGEFEGGYRSTQFTGTFAPIWPTHGSVGTTDYNCDPLGNCPGQINWSTKYFSSTTGFDLSWWGWIYDAEDHGTWVNAITGNSGDIL